MRGIQILAVGLIAAGVLALAFGGLAYTRETHDVRIGPLELSVEDRETITVPIWAGVGSIVIGGLILVGPRRR